MSFVHRFHPAALRTTLPRSPFGRVRQAIAVLSLGVCLCFSFVSQPSHAQSDGETETARQRFREGVAHYDRQDYEKARLAFLQAYLLKPHPAVLLNLAQSELRAGRHAEAADHFAQYIRGNPTAPAMEHAKAGFDEARQKVTELNVQVSAPGAAITVDGADVGRSPLPNAIYLTPGRHSVVARKGTASADKVLDAVAGRREYITLEMQEGYAATAPVTTTAAAPAGAEPGTDEGHGKSFFAWVGSSPAVVATVTVAGLALGTSAVLAGFANNRYSAANDARSQIMSALQQYADAGYIGTNTTPCGENGVANGVAMFDSSYPVNERTQLISQFANACDLFTERSDSGDRLKTLALVSLGIGAFATIGTVVWYFSDSEGGGSASADDKKIRGTASLTPLLSPDTQGLQLQLTF